MSNNWYTDGRNTLQKATRLNKNIVDVTIKNDSGFDHCPVEYSADLKYGKWAVLELAVNYFRERGFGF